MFAQGQGAEFFGALKCGRCRLSSSSFMSVIGWSATDRTSELLCHAKNMILGSMNSPSAPEWAKKYASTKGRATHDTSPISRNRPAKHRRQISAICLSYYAGFVHCTQNENHLWRCKKTAGGPYPVCPSPLTHERGNNSLTSSNSNHTVKYSPK